MHQYKESRPFVHTKRKALKIDSLKSKGLSDKKIRLDKIKRKEDQEVIDDERR